MHVSGTVVVDKNKESQTLWARSLQYKISECLQVFASKPLSKLYYRDKSPLLLLSFYTNDFLIVIVLFM